MDLIGTPRTADSQNFWGSKSMLFIVYSASVMCFELLFAARHYAVVFNSLWRRRSGVVRLEQ
jgi:hypothetical protein